MSDAREVKVYRVVVYRQQAFDRLFADPVVVDSTRPVVGARLLVNTETLGSMRPTYCALVILEWSPFGRVKVQFLGSTAQWLEALPRVVEVLS